MAVSGLGNSEREGVKRQRKRGFFSRSLTRASGDAVLLSTEASSEVHKGGRQRHSTDTRREATKRAEATPAFFLTLNLHFTEQAFFSSIFKHPLVETLYSTLCTNTLPNTPASFNVFESSLSS